MIRKPIDTQADHRDPVNGTKKLAQGTHKINNRNLQYSLTPEGTKEVAQRAYRYLQRTMSQVGRWKES